MRHAEIVAALRDVQRTGTTGAAQRDALMHHALITPTQSGTFKLTPNGRTLVAAGE